MDKGDKHNKAAKLRRLAEKALRKKTSAEGKNLSPEDTRRLIHELEVHQIELEMQNEELRSAQILLEESRSRYSDLYDFAPAGYFTLDKQGLILEVNLTGADLLQTNRKPLIKKPFSIFIHKDDQDKFYLHHNQVLKNKTRHICELRLKSKDRTGCYAQLVSIADKERDQTKTTVTDITGRVKADEAIRKSEGNYARLLESVSDGIAVLDRKWRYVLVNNALLHMAGKSREELLGKTIMDVFPGVEDSSFFKIYMSVLRTGKPEVVSDSYTFEGGRKGWFEVHAYPVPKGIFIIATDITERRKAEEELKNRQRLNELLINSLPYPAMLISKDKKILLANRNAMEAGAKPGGYCWEDFGKCQFIPDEYKEHRANHGKKSDHHIHCYFCQADKALDSNLPVRTEVHAWEKVWDTYWIPLDEEMYLHYAADITERRQAEEKLNQAAEELARSNTDLERFAYIASHDLKEPLRTVSSFVTLLQQRYGDQLDKDAGEFMGFIVDGTNRMGQLIDDLLTYSQVSAKKKLMPVDCNKILVRSLSNLTVLIEENRGKVTFDPLPKLMADDMQLELLFQNLMNNGIKFHGEEPPHVHITASRNNKDWLFSVTDNGIGIDPRSKDKIFNIFQRMHGRSEYPGTGIGLAICKKVVDLHGGKIWVESEKGTGSVFYFTLPDGRE